MSDFQAIADRVEIEALRAEATDAAMMRGCDRAAPQMIVGRYPQVSPYRSAA